MKRTKPDIILLCFFQQDKVDSHYHLSMQFEFQNFVQN
jgi:hypothetical protein